MERGEIEIEHGFTSAPTQYRLYGLRVWKEVSVRLVCSILQSFFVKPLLVNKGINFITALYCHIDCLGSRLFGVM